MASLLSLASGYGTFAPPAPAVARVQQQLAAATGLPGSPAAGLPALREALAARFRHLGAAAAGPEQFVVTPGAKAALFLLLSTVLRPADEVLLLTPNWFGFGELVARAGGRLRTLPLSAATHYALPLDSIRAALTPRTRVLLLSNPSNPTGRVYTRAELTALLAVTSEFADLYVLSDEIYDGIHFGPEAVPSLLALPDPHDRHLVVSGYSKSLALIGWGVGYLAAPPAVAQACAERQFATTGAVATLSQLAALAATEAAPAISAGLCQQLLPNRRYLLDFLATLPGALPHPPTGTYYAFPDLRAFLPPGQPPDAASAHLAARLRAAGVEVVDGASCWAPGFARLSYAVPPPDLHEAVRRLQQVLR